MTNPYESAFGGENPEDSGQEEKKPLDFSDLPPMDNTPEPLDELLEKCRSFTTEAQAFVRILTNIRAADHQVPLILRQSWFRYLIQVDDPNQQDNLAAERKYYQLLEDKFRMVIEPMKQLAKLHLDIIRQYHSDIDEHYYSTEKESLQVKREIEQLRGDISLQRQILHDAQDALSTLALAMEATETRLAAYVNIGGENNIAAAELALIKRDRLQLTDGILHSFNYQFFALNIVDKTSLRFGLLPKQTLTQYISKLSLAFEVRN